MIKDIYIPEHVTRGIRTLKDAYRPAAVWGADFETVKGKPYTIQVYARGTVHFEYLERPEDGLWRFLDHVEKSPQKAIRCYWWYLPYDLPCLLYSSLEKFKLREFVLGFEYAGKYGKITVSCNKSWWASIKWGGYSVKLIDACQYFRTSLDKAAKQLLNERKHEKPDGLGERKLRGRGFQKYARRDALMTYRIGKIIENFHDNFGISSTISASQFASKVLRKSFLKRTIPYIPQPVETAGMLSYHGGLNWVTTDAPKFYRRVSEFDITSAYPAAFVQLPDFSRSGGRWTRTRNPRSAQHGFVEISFIEQCGYYGVRGHSFEMLQSGRVWITLYEYQSSHGCLKDCKILDGWVWKGGGASPFKKYMEHFFDEKTNADNPAQKEFAKICLNGISGKLIQNWDDGNGLPTAGGLWNPAIASLVTGYTRAAMHRYLHDHAGIHCATDSFFTQRQRVRCTPGMGGLARKARGDLLLLRNKLYVFFKAGSSEIIKWGAHGFWGTADDLIRLWKERKTKYAVTHIYKVREAFIQGKVPLAAQRVQRTLNICWKRFVKEAQAR